LSEQENPIQIEKARLAKLHAEYMKKREPLDREHKSRMRVTKDEYVRAGIDEEYTAKRDVMDKEYNEKRIAVVKQYHKPSAGNTQ
jgi:hypothetical protein